MKRGLIFFVGAISLFVTLGFWGHINVKNNVISYNEFHDIPQEAGVYSWIPDFFPTDARDITIFTDVESDSFYSEFYLTGVPSKNFEDTLTLRASSQGVDYLNQDDIVSAWCKEGDSIDSQNKDHFNSLYLVSKRSENKYHILLMRGRDKDELEKQKLKSCAPVHSNK